MTVPYWHDAPLIFNIFFKHFYCLSKQGIINANISTFIYIYILIYICATLPAAAVTATKPTTFRATYNKHSFYMQKEKLNRNLYKNCM